MRRFLVSFLLAALAGMVRAQSSAHYRLEEHTLNNGGRPDAGVTATSTSFVVSQDAIGEGVAGAVLTGALYTVASGFPSGYGPAGEVRRVRFVDDTHLVWQADPSALAYNLYRGLLSDLSNAPSGSCQQQSLPGTSAEDSDLVPLEDGFLFWVTAVGRLGDEGTMGFESDGDERINAMPCP